MFWVPTPATGYLVAATFIIGLGIGGTAAYKIERANVLKLELAISQANKQAVTALSKAKERVAMAEKNALKLNNDLEASREKAIETINSYHDQLASAMRLRSNNHPSCANAVPERSDTPINTENEKNTDYISSGLSQLLQDALAKADAAAVDKNELLDFVNNNCGIAK